MPQLAAAAVPVAGNQLEAALSACARDRAPVAGAVRRSESLSFYLDLVGAVTVMSLVLLAAILA